MSDLRRRSSLGNGRGSLWGTALKGLEDTADDLRERLSPLALRGGPTKIETLADEINYTPFPVRHPSIPREEQATPMTDERSHMSNEELTDEGSRASGRSAHDYALSGWLRVPMALTAALYAPFVLAEWIQARRTGIPMDKSEGGAVMVLIGIPLMVLWAPTYPLFWVGGAVVSAARLWTRSGAR